MLLYSYNPLMATILFKVSDVRVTPGAYLTRRSITKIAISCVKIASSQRIGGHDHEATCP
jgi:hypothetical protein